jgi:D-glycero-alpha-D-manno-heptose-7-phosphate kinase
MIITKTPFRISFAGGGTDIPSFYERHPGAVVSTAIDKYVYITVNKKFDDDIRLAYSKTELVENIDSLEHQRVKEAMKLTGVTKGIEITTMADVPSKGTGLGSSSSFTVGLLKALHAYKGNLVSSPKLADQACDIEINRMKEPIGKQDQYIAALGGFQFIEFLSNGDVLADPILIDGNAKKRLEQSLMMFYTGKTRSTAEVLSDQGKRADVNFDNLLRMKGLAIELRNCLLKKQVEKVGEIMNEGWKLKRTLSSKISNSDIDKWYKDAMDAGAIGGKVAGSGGGGFMFFYCPKENQDRVRKALPLKEIRLGFEPQGSKIIYVGD